MTQRKHCAPNEALEAAKAKHEPQWQRAEDMEEFNASLQDGCSTLYPRDVMGEYGINCAYVCGWTGSYRGMFDDMISKMIF